MTKTVSRSFVERYAPALARPHEAGRSGPPTPAPAPVPIIADTPVVPATPKPAEQGTPVAWLHEEFPEALCITDSLKNRWLLTYDGPDGENLCCKHAVQYTIPVYR